MDKIYTPERYPHVSHKIKLGEHFEGYKNHISHSWMYKNSAQVNYKRSVQHKIGAMMTGTDEETLKKLDEACGIHNFYPPSENGEAVEIPTLRKQRRGRKPGPKTNPNEDALLDKAAITLSSSAEQKTLRSHRKMYQKRVKDIERSAISTFVRESTQSTAIKVPEDFVLVARVFKPFNAMSESTYHTQDFLLRGSLGLIAFKDALTCENDKFEVSQNGDKVPMKNLVLSSMFYFGNTFYCDTPNIACPDYSEPIREWMKSHPKVNFGNAESRSMSETLFSDLEIRLGFPYVFKHLSECEHNIVFVDARLMTPDDPKDLGAYPLVVDNLSPVLYCVSCDTYGAVYMAEDDDVPISPALLCSKCIKVLYGVDRNGEPKVPEGTVKIPLDRAYAPPDETDETNRVVEAGDTDGEADDD